MKPLNTETYKIGDYRFELKQFDSRIHLPSKVGLFGAECLEKFCNDKNNRTKREQINFKNNNIKSICDVGIGAGHYAILSGMMFSELQNVFGIDILQKANDNAHYNWNLNINKNQNKIKFKTITADIDDAFEYFIKNKIKFNLIICNLPNIGPSSGVTDPFNITKDEEGRYGLNTLLSSGWKCLQKGGFIFTTDTTLNNMKKTDKYLENTLNLKLNRDWFVLKSIKMDIPFLRYGYKNISKEWIKNMIKTKRILIDDNNKYYQIRRFLLIRKPAISKL
eukprot:482715_1